MKLTYQLEVRDETDAEKIANLIRKGWVENPAPAHDPETQHAPRWNGSESVVETIPLADLKTRLTAEAEQQHLAALGAGLDVGGVTLSATSEARDKFIGKALMLQIAISSGAISASTPTTIFDATGTPVTRAAGDMLLLLLGYGAAYEAAEVAHQNRLAQIAAAQAHEDLP